MMLKNKIISAIITIIIVIFIIPLFIQYTYHLSYSAYGTAFTAPAMLIAIVVSILLEKYSKNKNPFLMYIKHLICTLIFALLYSLFNFDLFKDTLYLTFSIGSIYITIFVIIDYLLKNFRKNQ